MAARGSHPALRADVDQLDGGEIPGAQQAFDAAEPSVSDEWAVLVRPRRSGRDYRRQIAIDVAVVVVALLIVALLS